MGDTKELDRSLMPLGGGGFTRLRIGVGRSAGDRDVVDHVLGEFDQDQTKVLGELLQTASEAIVTVITKGTKNGMNRYNQNKQ
jgi:peptidyl-tRNA hydrolase, PTH1 family